MKHSEGVHIAKIMTNHAIIMINQIYVYKRTRQPLQNGTIRDIE